MIVRSSIVLAFIAIMLAGCGRRTSAGTAGGSMVQTFGSTASPDGSMRLEVTRRQESLVHFEVVDSTSGKEVVSDYIGSDAMRWFLYWDTPNRLWAYGSDSGYFQVFDFAHDGSATWKLVDGSFPVPQAVWESLPPSLQTKFKAQQGVAPQSATRSESDSDGNHKPQPESEARSR